MASGFFVAGTDNDVGKTRVSIALMRKLLANLAFLQAHIHSPLLGVLPHTEKPDADFLASCINF